MANYCGFTRTNYFKTTDPEKLRDIVERIVWTDGDLSFFAEEKGAYGFGAYSSILGLRPAQGIDNDPDDEDLNTEDFDSEEVYAALQEILAPDDAIIITEIGYEKLRYLTAYATIITCDEIKYINLETTALDVARELTGNLEFSTQMSY